jgi:hypothetical protein
MRRRSSNMLRRSSISVVRRRGSSSVVRRRRLSLSVCRGRLRGDMWLLLLLHPHRKRIEF